MQQLAAQLGLQAQGQGPNPALAQLANTTGQNIAATTAAMAGARGASANPGLIARQAAQQGAATQQNAVGQGAALMAQQQLAAQQQLQAQQQAQAALASQQVQQGVGAAGVGANAAMQHNQTQQQVLDAYNKAQIANAAQANSANATVQNGAQSGSAGLLGGIVGGVGSAIGLAEGGEVPATTEAAKPVAKAPGILEQIGQHMAQTNKPDRDYQGGHAIGSTIGNGLVSIFGGGAPAPVPAAVPTVTPVPAAHVAPMPGGTMYAAGGGQVPETGPRSHAGRHLSGKMSQQERDLAIVKEENERTKSLYQRGVDVPSVKGKDGTVQSDPYGGYAKGGNVGSALKRGGEVPGKAKVKGDSYVNDTVDAKLSPQEIVIPRSVTQSADPVRGAAEFVAAVLAKKNGAKRK